MTGAVCERPTRSWRALRSLSWYASVKALLTLSRGSVP